MSSNRDHQRNQEANEGKGGAGCQSRATELLIGKNLRFSTNMTYTHSGVSAFISATEKEININSALGVGLAAEGVRPNGPEQAGSTSLGTIKVSQ